MRLIWIYRERRELGGKQTFAWLISSNIEMSLTRWLTTIISMSVELR